MVAQFGLRAPRRLIALAAFAVGMFVLLGALAQPLKAELGGVLLNRELQARMAASPDDQADPERWKPWPWADIAPIAELNFPELGERRVVVDSASGEALAWGVGHVPQTAPLGTSGVSAVAGHRDSTFQILGDVHEGDSVELTTLDGETIRYIVEERIVVDSRIAALPIDHDGADELLLMTCWPIGALVSGPDRLIVRARAVPWRGSDSAES